MAKIIEKARPAGIPVLRWRNTGIKVTSARQASLVQDYSSIRIFTWPAIFPFRKPVQVAYGVVAYTHLLRSLMERTLLVTLQNCWYLLPLSNLMVQFLSYLPLVPRTNYCQLFELRILYLPKKRNQTNLSWRKRGRAVRRPRGPEFRNHPECKAGFILCSLEFEYSATLVPPSWDS